MRAGYAQAPHPNGRRAMTIKVGDAVPDATLIKATDAGPQPVIDRGAVRRAHRRAVLGARRVHADLLGASTCPATSPTPTRCRRRGVDEIVCVSVNDAFVMGAWGKSAGAAGKVTMLADGNGEFVRRSA